MTQVTILHDPYPYEPFECICD